MIGSGIKQNWPIYSNTKLSIFQKWTGKAERLGNWSVFLAEQEWTNEWIWEKRAFACLNRLSPSLASLISPSPPRILTHPLPERAPSPIHPSIPPTPTLSPTPRTSDIDKKQPLYCKREPAQKGDWLPNAMNSCFMTEYLSSQSVLGNNGAFLHFCLSRSVSHRGAGWWWWWGRRRQTW